MPVPHLTPDQVAAMTPEEQTAIVSRMNEIIGSAFKQVEDELGVTPVIRTIPQPPAQHVIVADFISNPTTPMSEEEVQTPVEEVVAPEVAPEATEEATPEVTAEPVSGEPVAA